MSDSKITKNFRSLGLGVTLALLLWLLVANRTELVAILQAMSAMDSSWFVSAASTQIAYLLMQASFYRRTFDVVGVPWSFWEVQWLVLGSFFANVVAPTGGVAGGALFVAQAEQSREPGSGSRAAVGVILQKICFALSFLPFLAAGFFLLRTHHSLKLYHLVGGAIFLLITSVQCLLLVKGLVEPSRLRPFFQKVERKIRALQARLRLTPWEPGWSNSLAEEMAEASIAVAANPPGVTQAVILALICQLLDIFSLALLFPAFHQPLQVATVLAGFSVCILFWMVSITPQGVGVVEGGMTLTLISLGVPAASATAITLVYRGLTFWIPALIGFFVLNKPRALSAQQRDRLFSLTPKLLAAATAAFGAIGLLSSALPALRYRLHWLPALFSSDWRHGAYLVTLLASLGLILLANGLRRRKRVAWWYSITLLLVSSVAHLIKGFDYEEASIALVVALWLLLSRREFFAKSGPPNYRSLLPSIALAATLIWLYGVVGISHLLHLNVVDSTLELGKVLRGNSILWDSGTFGRHLADSLRLTSMAVALSLLTQFFKPVSEDGPATVEDRERAEGIVEKYGATSLVFFTLLPDKSYYFPNEQTMLAYTVRGRIALTLGDPVGPDELLAQALETWCNYCQGNDWIPAFTQVLPQNLPIYRELGFHAIALGDEAIVDVKTFALKGKHFKSLRSRMNRFEKEGYRCRYLDAPQSPDVLRQLRAVSDNWLSAVNGQEKGFSLGWFDEDYLESCPVMVVLSPQQEIVAFANIVDEFQLNEMTIDLMRHTRSAPSGTMDVLFVNLFEKARELGFDSFSLGLSPLAGVGESGDDSLPEKTLHFVFENINHFYNFKGLYEFKEKFRPRWEPRYLIYRAGTLPAVTRAMLRAGSGDNFLWKQSRSILSRRRIKGKARRKHSPTEEPGHESRGRSVPEQ